MNVVDFYVLPQGDAPSSSPVLMKCLECEETLTAQDSDKHAHNKHKAASMRVFVSESAYHHWKETNG